MNVSKPLRRYRFYARWASAASNGGYPRAEKCWANYVFGKHPAKQCLELNRPNRREQRCSGTLGAKCSPRSNSKQLKKDWQIFRKPKIFQSQNRQFFGRWARLSSTKLNPTPKAACLIRLKQRLSRLCFLPKIKFHWAKNPFRLLKSKFRTHSKIWKTCVRDGKTKEFVQTLDSIYKAETPEKNNLAPFFLAFETGRSWRPRSKCRALWCVSWKIHSDWQENFLHERFAVRSKSDE